MRCWCGYLSGVRCRLFAYGPADAIAVPKPHHLFPDLNPDWFLPRDAMHPQYMLWPCVCVCLSQVGVLLKWLNIGSHKQHHTIAQGLYFSDAKDLREIRPGSPPTGAPNAGGVGQNRRLSTNNRLYLENGTR